MSRKEHIKGDSCPGCNKRLDTAHPVLKEWFLTQVKTDFPDCHVSWAWRGQEDQNAFLEQKKSELSWPNSPHNFEYAGKPMALAIDLFQLIEFTGLAAWVWSYFEKIYYHAINRKPGITVAWGGNWRGKFKDGPHFEIKNYRDVMDGKVDPDTITLSFEGVSVK